MYEMGTLRYIHSELISILGTGRLVNRYKVRRSFAFVSIWYVDVIEEGLV